MRMTNRSEEVKVLKRLSMLFFEEVMRAICNLN